MRLLSRAVTVLVAAESSVLLSGFAQWALDRRLLVWGTRLLVLTSLSLSDLLLLMRTHWTFSMMNMLLMNVEHTSASLRYSYGAASCHSDKILLHALFMENLVINCSACTYEK